MRRCACESIKERNILSKAGVRSSLQAKKSVHRTIYAVPKLPLSTSCETGKVKIRERWVIIYILIASSLAVKGS